MRSKYVAYIGSYSYTGSAKGITICDVDMEKGQFIKRTEVEVNNSSYMVASRDEKTLYSIADEGVIAFRIMGNGGLSKLNTKNIRGMRGCHLSVDKSGTVRWEILLTVYMIRESVPLRSELSAPMFPVQE